MHHCPECGASNIRRSQYRSWLERLRKTFSERRPHRCRACGWRGWGLPTGRGLPEEWLAQVEPPDLDGVEGALQPTTHETSSRERDA
jgi:hypothetical protein